MNFQYIFVKHLICIMDLMLEKQSNLHINMQLKMTLKYQKTGKRVKQLELNGFIYS